MKQLVLYGAGKRGHEMLDFLKYCGLDTYVFSFCDSNSRLWGSEIEGIKILSFEDCKERNLPFAVTVNNPRFKDEILGYLKINNAEWYEDVFRCFQLKFGFDMTMLNRKYCEYYHIDAMNSYFDEAEQASVMDVFWDENSPFYKMFRELDLENIVELACGRGRHVVKYLGHAKQITLVDVLEKNIECCKKRFDGMSNIRYYKNNGMDLSELEDGGYSSLFTYDAMVHFEMFDVNRYINETYRILKNTGKALFHHSNLVTSYKQAFMKSENPGGRNFMSKELFAYLAYRAGFEVLDQKVIDWSLPNMDCITLVQKRA